MENMSYFIVFCLISGIKDEQAGPWVHRRPVRSAVQNRVATHSLYIPSPHGEGEAAPSSALSNLPPSLCLSHRIMVHPKNKNATNKKPKPRRQRDGVKKHGKQTDIEEFRVQLDVLGLKIVEVTADGNCFFRALADQLHGNEDEHQKYREMVVKYIMNHREDFEPFIEDEVPFDEYCRTMEKDGTWAGNMELQAASLVTRRNICIHRFSSPRWYISNFSGHQDDMIHLCYHDGEHYNSVRLKEDSCEGPARPIIIKVDAHISRKDHNDKATTNKSSKGSSCRSFNRESVKLVMMGTGCKDVDKVEQVLQEVDGDVNAAIEFLIAEQDMDLHENAQSTNDRSMENDLVQDFSGEGQSQEPGLPEVASEDLRRNKERRIVLANLK
ncbi:OVARIAN TUMOR DOMAIN-containing deubiquitinating enzyme 7-like isoform X2 [Zingiber officinale]|uniref:OVARIAN TUMOR DOMAIN-containing deubiquitinating enzyme 7-like isoform X2 n=1 Tax=Zingiber officinale TaxID=94328 RepID=UPI001C4C6737|nr:OVARIAN TUMOR DOMAIN-containing deubiquitinating enzyme 7-like isoform X2 [Zingiber officinale]